MTPSMNIAYHAFLMILQLLYCEVSKARNLFMTSTKMQQHSMFNVSFWWALKVKYCQAQGHLSSPVNSCGVYTSDWGPWDMGWLAFPFGHFFLADSPIQSFVMTRGRSDDGRWSVKAKVSKVSDKSLTLLDSKLLGFCLSRDFLTSIHTLLKNSWQQKISNAEFLSSLVKHFPCFTNIRKFTSYI